MEIINLPLMDGFLVETVDPRSPAEKNAIQGGRLPLTILGKEFLLGGDIVTEINGQPLINPENFSKLLDSLKVGDKLRLMLFHRGETRSIELELTERPILPGDVRSGPSNALPPAQHPLLDFPLQ